LRMRVIRVTHPRGQNHWPMEVFPSIQKKSLENPSWDFHELQLGEKGNPNCTESP